MILLIVANVSKIFSEICSLYKKSLNYGILVTTGYFKYSKLYMYFDCVAGHQNNARSWWKLLGLKNKILRILIQKIEIQTHSRLSTKSWRVRICKNNFYLMQCLPNAYQFKDSTL